jgi:Methyltransferase domain
MNRASIVRTLIRHLNAETYLEIGVSRGHTFLAIDCPQKIAVDPVNRTTLHSLLLRERSLMLSAAWFYRRLRQLLAWERARFFQLTSNEFFRIAPDILAEHQVHVSLIDGLHTYRQALMDVLNTTRFLHPRGVIVMHDCNPATEASALPAASYEDARSRAVSGWDGCWSGDVWKCIVHIRSLLPHLEAFVLDCDYGIGIVRKSSARNSLAYGEDEIERMTYADLAKNRGALLDLRPVSSFDDFIRSLRPIERRQAVSIPR